MCPEVGDGLGNLCRSTALAAQWLEDGAVSEDQVFGLMLLIGLCEDMMRPVVSSFNADFRASEAHGLVSSKLGILTQPVFEADLLIEKALTCTQGRKPERSPLGQPRPLSCRSLNPAKELAKRPHCPSAPKPSASC